MKLGLFNPVFAIVTIVGMAASAIAQAPPWKVELETRSGSVDPTGIVVDSTGYAVTLEPARGLQMPRCARLDGAELARAAENVAWLMKNVKVGEGEWYGQCRDDPRVKLFIQSGDQVLPLGYPLNQTCRDVEPPLAMMQLVDQLLALREISLKRCRPDDR